MRLSLQAGWAAVVRIRHAHCEGGYSLRKHLWRGNTEGGIHVLVRKVGINGDISHEPPERILANRFPFVPNVLLPELWVRRLVKRLLLWVPR